MRNRDFRRELEHVDIPGEHEARVRAWDVVQAAFAAREPVSWRRRRARPLLAFALVAAAVAAALSPPGLALLGSIREAVGVEEADPALFSLPTGGRVLVNSSAGPWIVDKDGSKRWLGDYREASWSPNGLFVVATRPNALVALEPNRRVRWTLARPRVRFPRWGGSRIDTRIAYLSGSRLHVVAGDGTGDVDAGGLPAAAPVAPVWRPGRPHVVAYATTRGRVHVYEPDSGSLHWRSAPFPRPRQLVWSSDGAFLALVTRDKVVVFAGSGGKPRSVRWMRGVVDAQFAPRSHRLVLVRAREVLVIDAERSRARPQRIFAGAGRFTSSAWSPDGRWFLVAWRDADQWVFIRPAGMRKIEAVSDISAQFESAQFPSLAGWCCP